MLCDSCKNQLISLSQREREREKVKAKQKIEAEDMSQRIPTAMRS